MEQLGRRRPERRFKAVVKEEMQKVGATEADDPPWRRLKGEGEE